MKLTGRALQKGLSLVRIWGAQRKSHNAKKHNRDPNSIWNPTIAFASLWNRIIGGWDFLGTVKEEVAIKIVNQIKIVKQQNFWNRMS